jgi:hypothetical protein
MTKAEKLHANALREQKRNIKVGLAKPTKRTGG